MGEEHQAPYSSMDETDHGGMDKRFPNKDEQLANKRLQLKKLKSNVNFTELGRSEIELKANIYYHISNPLKRWKTDRSPPVLLALQLAKTICIVTQAVYFLNSSANHQSYVVRNTGLLFSCVLLSQCDTGQNRYYAYSIADAQNVLNLSSTKFYSLGNAPVSGYDLAKTPNGTIQPIQVVLTQFAVAQLNPSEDSYVIDTTYITTSFQLDPQYDIIQQFYNKSEDSNFQRFVRMDLVLNLKNIEIVSSSVVQCYIVTVTVHFKAHGGGIIEYYLDNSRRCTSCGENSTLTLPDNYRSIKVSNTVLDVLVLIVCGASLISVFINEKKSYKLAKAMGEFYKNQLNIDLTWKERIPIFTRGHVFDILSDILTFIGTIIKIRLDYDLCLLTPSASSQTDMVRILLGLGVLIQAAVILRFVSYFQQFNAIYRVLSIALPRLGKYIICVLVLFLAFMVCGWVVLDPFHYKFTSFWESFHALYTMMHGDDLYSTFEGITVSDDMEAYIFSQIFFTIFLMLFIYAILNLTISLIMESYEESQMESIALKNEVRRFVYSGPLTGQGVALRDVTAVTKYVDPSLILRRVRHGSDH